MRRKIAIAASARYIGANEEIEKQFQSHYDIVHDIAVDTSARGRGHHGGGQRDQAQIATS